MTAAVILAYMIFYRFGIDQTGSGTSTSVVGTVYGWEFQVEGQKSPIRNVVVVATSPADVQVTRADEKGRFRFLSLLPGKYRINAIYPGWAWGCHGTRDYPVELDAGIKYRVDVVLVPQCK
jgi:hypothetical protein